MDDFSAAGIAWFAIALIFCGSGMVGHSISTNSISADCRDFGKFSINNKVYECKLIEINSK